MSANWKHMPRDPVRRGVSEGQSASKQMTAFLFLIVAPAVLLLAIWIMQAYERKRNRINLS